MRAGVVLAALLLCGCGWVEVGDPGTAGKKSQASAPRKAAPEDGRIRVRKGDSVYLIARRHGIAMRDIIERNGLTAPYHLREGQMLTLPAPRKHVVVSGDSLWKISHRYDVPIAALVRANGLKKPYVIYPGTALRIPRRTEPPPEDIAETRAVAASAPAKPPEKPSRPARAAGMPPVPSPSPVAQAETTSPSRSPIAKPLVTPVPRRRRPPALVSANRAGPARSATVPAPAAGSATAPARRRNRNPHREPWPSRRRPRLGRP